MAGQFEVEPRARYASSLMRQFNTAQPDSVQKIVEGATKLPDGVWARITTAERRAGHILEDFQKRADEVALLGILEGPEMSLATILRIQDGICETMGWEKPSMPHRLDLCATACIAAASQRLHAYVANPQELPEESQAVQVEATPQGARMKIEIDRSWNHLDSASLYLDRAKHLQMMVQDPGATQLTTTYVESFRDTALQKRLKESAERNRDTETEEPTPKSAKSMTEVGYPDDVIYELSARVLVEAAREGTIGKNSADPWSMEDALIWMKHEVIRPEISPEAVARLMSFAWLNRARNELEEENYKTPFGDPKGTKSPQLDTIVGLLNRANSFMTAMIPYYFDLDRMYDSDFRKGLITQIQGRES